VDGCFTAYNTALSRSALKKDRFLNGKAAAGAKAAAPQARPEWAVSRPAAANGGAGAETDASAAPQPRTEAPRPAAPVAPPAAAAHPLFAPRPDSPFADKLKQALQPAGPKQD
jgi:hypothetical protein